MSEITVLSGKGGTGKTSITAGLISLFKNTIVTDCDVDAADLHLLLNPEYSEENNLDIGFLYHINQEICKNCGICFKNCNFHAIEYNKKQYKIDNFHCESCDLCYKICPSNAIIKTQNQNNKWFVSKTRYGTFIHAKMGAGEENSGKLVRKVRDIAREKSVLQSASYIINDGPPGIGCPVIASIIGTDKILLVTEPTESAIHDAKRVISLAKKLNIPVYVVINKCDINLKIRDKFLATLKEINTPLIGEFPYNEIWLNAMLQQKTIVEYAPKSKEVAILNNVCRIISKDHATI